MMFILLVFLPVINPLGHYATVENVIRSYWARRPSSQKWEEHFETNNALLFMSNDCHQTAAIEITFSRPFNLVTYETTWSAV